MLWFYADAGKHQGPVDEAGLARLYAEGSVTADTLVWNAELAAWRRYDEVAPGVLPGSGDASNRCLECGEIRPADDLIHLGGVAVCGRCKGIFLRRLKQGTLPEHTLHFAGFWVRLCAKAVDFVILGAMQASVGGFLIGLLAPDTPLGFTAIGLATVLFGIILHVIYNAWFLGQFGATPGKMAFGLRVLVPDGLALSYVRALARSAAELVSGLIFYLGYIMAAFDTQKRALHDYVCDTRVVRE